MLTPSLLLAPWLARAELGDLATWIGAIANVATVVLALTASLVGFRIYRIESARDQRAEQDRGERTADERRRQAQMVSLWYAPITRETVENSPVSARAQFRRMTKVWAAHILNASHLPVYDVEVTFHRRRPEAGAHASMTADLIRAIPPHQTAMTIELPEELVNEVPAEQLSDGVDVSLTFRDSAGRRWMRDGSGYLREMPSPLSRPEWYSMRWR
ncbi:hypothetical protein OHQ88_33565 (plasmid) [Micromonospora zamorensis]|uniref:hypothetical protein n=1 Tax=Micromonospora zamorensis TaxID=709883 RepID=UPI002E1A42C1